MIAGSLGPMGEIIRVDTDAVAADEAREERQEVPLGSCRRQHVAGIDAHLMKDRGQLIHERYVEIALGVFDHLRRLGNSD